MNQRMRNGARVLGKTCVGRLWACAAGAALLVSCGGGDGVGIGSGQDPDPVLVDYPLFYVQRPLPDDGLGNLPVRDLRDLLTVEFGADLYMRARASISAPETNITGEITGGMGDVRDVSVSADGERVLFSMRTPIDPDAGDLDQPTWNIWEYSVPDGTLRRVITDDITAEEGHDRFAQFLPDGRIVFSSTRQSRAVARLLDEGKPQFAAITEDRVEPALVLHVMDPDGSNIRQISFNQSHDLSPFVLADGRVMYARQDGMVSTNQISLFELNPDGTDLQLLYGFDSHLTGTDDTLVEFFQPRELQDGRVVALLSPPRTDNYGGQLVVIDVAQYINNRQPTADNAGVLNGPAQVPAINVDVLTTPGISPGGRYASVWPLWDGTDRLIVSWSVCQLMDGAGELLPCTDENLALPDAEEAPPAYGIWIYDGAEATQLPVVVSREGYIYTDVAVAQPRTRPEFIPDAAESGSFDAELVAEEAGILDIRSVYDINGVDTAVPGIAELADPAIATADDRPARFLRLYRAVGIPERTILPIDSSAYGVSRLVGMRELVGYAPIEPDGSVRVKVPADVPLSIDVVDATGRRISDRHQFWLQARPGEEVECSGCHERFNNPVSHGRRDAFDSIYTGAAGNGVPFPNTDPLLVPTVSMGETMAQARTQADPAVLEPTLDMEYVDVWTYEPDAGRAPDEPLAIRYADLMTEPPLTNGCEPWTVACRVTINYAEHIQPLWEVSRPVIDPDTSMEIDNHRCIDCHALRDDTGALIEPADRGQLELTGEASGEDPVHAVSYRELMFADLAQEIRDGAIQDRRVDTGQVDDDGNPVTTPVVVPAQFTTSGAVSGPAFFARFEAGGPHPGWLSAAELRLIAEWLDLGAQYYNNPFDAPLD